MSTKDPYPPLMSLQSPSYERARKEALHPAPVGISQVVAIFAQLSEAEQNAAVACAEVAEMSKDSALANQLRGEATTHEGRRAALGDVIEKLGGSAPRVDECRAILTHGIDAVTHAGSDRDALLDLSAMRGELRNLYVESMKSAYLDEA